MTDSNDVKGFKAIILIHTSVKLVTGMGSCRGYLGGNFNPHEREARDRIIDLRYFKRQDFNPHEREARDICIRSVHIISILF